MLFDAYNRAGLWILQRYPPANASGAQLEWNTCDPHELEQAVPGLVFDCEWWYWDADETRRYYSPLYKL